MIVGIDVDSTICNTTECVLTYINERLPITPLRITDITGYSIEDALPDEFKWIVESAFRDKLMWKNVQLIAGAYENIEKLYNDGHEIFFVTSSLHENIYKKVKFLTRSFPFLTKEYVETHTIGIRRKQLLNIDILIDDCMSNLIGKRTYFSIALASPWNRDCFEDGNYVRVNNWNDVYAKVKQIERGEL